MTSVRRALVVVALTTLIATSLAGARMLQRADRFDHEQHAQLFPSCTSCHAGILTGATPWPAARACVSCHDGTVEKRVTWTPPPTLPRTNLDFDHREHAVRFSRRHSVTVDSAGRCAACHIASGKAWMQISLAVSGSCLSCHGITTPHLAAPDTACATCHVTLAEATRLTRADIAGFQEPPSHLEPDFRAQGHGRLAAPSRPPERVAGSCATCHAQDFCLQCHVNAPVTPAIQALARDPRSLAIVATLREPDSHRAPGFLESHGRRIGNGATCATCHTQESCTTCHAGVAPNPVGQLAKAGPGRAVGAVTSRRRPATHGADFTNLHAPFARAASRSCTTCHARTECLSCHLPAPGASGGYHPANFLTRHPAAAIARSSNCADCHNTTGFCAGCHAQAGLRANGPLRAGYHDANPNFLFGHGTAARQGLETCVSCHAERDCLTCHSAEGGRRFNPHGPGFDAERLRRKNPEMCTVCHGVAIPPSP